MYWCTDRQFQLQVLSRTAYGLVFLLLAALCFIAAWRVFWAGRRGPHSGKQASGAEDNARGGMLALLFSLLGGTVAMLGVELHVWPVLYLLTG